MADFFGRPPLRPLARAARRLTGVLIPFVALPPRRPSATAWGFFIRRYDEKPRMLGSDEL